MTFDRKASILAAAEQAFTSFGYRATTMDLVARIANVGKGTIYTFFKNKEELFYEIMNQFIRNLKHVALRAVRPEDSFFDNLHHALYDMLELRKEHQLTIKLTQEVKEFGTLQAKQALTNLEDAILFFIEGYVKEAIDRDEIRPCPPRITAFVILHLYLSLVFEWEQRHEPLSREEIADLFDLYLAKGLKNRHENEGAPD